MKKPEIIVRHADKRDFDFVSQDGYLLPVYIERKLKDNDIFIAIRGGERVGYLRLERLWSKLPYIELIRVLEPHRRLGVGSALLTYAEEEIVKKGNFTIYSSSQVDEPEPQAWHRRMGFEECGILAGVNEGGVGEIFFRKKLNPNNNAV